MFSSNTCSCHKLEKYKHKENGVGMLVRSQGENIKRDIEMKKLCGYKLELFVTVPVSNSENVLQLHFYKYIYNMNVSKVLAQY